MRKLISVQNLSEMKIYCKTQNTMICFHYKGTQPNPSLKKRRAYLQS